MSKSPDQLPFYDWAFNLPRGKALAKVWAKIPDDTDVLITHGPPYGILDKTERGEHCGCQDLLERIKVIQLKLHIFGHIHEGYGMFQDESTTFVNGSVCDADYNPRNAAQVYEI